MKKLIALFIIFLFPLAGFAEPPEELSKWPDLTSTVAMGPTGLIVSTASPPPAGGTFNEGFNFRSTLAYVTDPADTQFVDDYDTYPQTNNGVTYGWSDAIGNVRDRSTGVDARLAGSNWYSSCCSDEYFQVDLPSAGTYYVRLAIGAYDGASEVDVDICDNTTVKATITTGWATDTTGADYVLDATDVERSSSADWVTNNAAAQITFSTTTFRLYFRDTDDASGNRIRHIQIYN
jgi:hypothetical protein